MDDGEGSTTPEGWYPDPDDGDRLRYFDGVSWSDRTKPQSAPAPSAKDRVPNKSDAVFGATQGESGTEGSDGQSGPRAVVAIAVAVIVALVAVAAWQLTSEGHTDWEQVCQEDISAVSTAAAQIIAGSFLGDDAQVEEGVRAAETIANKWRDADDEELAATGQDLQDGLRNVGSGSADENIGSVMGEALGEAGSLCEEHGVEVEYE